MTDKQADIMISVLEKIEKHLQAIDWKFWELHQQFKGQFDATSETEVSTDVDELETLAEIVSTPTAASVATAAAVKHTLKYPSIEILK